MLRIYCDCCGRDAMHCAYDVRVSLLHNPVPQDHFATFSEPTISSDPHKMRFTLCEKCYREMGFPNIYEANEENTLRFRLERPQQLHVVRDSSGQWNLTEPKRWKKSWATGETSRECPWCGITQTVTIIPGKNKVAFAYCPYCGNPVSDGVKEDGGHDE